MNAIRIAAIALIVAGVLGLAYGGFSYTQDTQQAKIGPIELSVTEKQTVNVPIWAGVAAIVAGGALLALRREEGLTLRVLAGYGARSSFISCAGRSAHPHPGS